MKRLNPLLLLRNPRTVSGAAWLAVIVIALALASLSAIADNQVPPIAARGAAVQGGPAPAVALEFTGEVMGWTEPCG